MRPATRLLGLALGLVPGGRPLARSSLVRCPPCIYSQRCYSSPVRNLTIAEAEDGDDGPMFDLEAARKGEPTHAPVFKHLPEFIPSQYIAHERDKRFPPTTPTAPIPTSSTPPTPNTVPLLQDPEDQEGRDRWKKTVKPYKMSYKLMLAHETRFLTKPYNAEAASVDYPPDHLAILARQQLARQQFADAEEALVHSINTANATTDASTSSSEPPFQETPAVPWTTSRFRISSSRVADAYLEFGQEGVDEVLFDATTKRDEHDNERDEVIRENEEEMRRRKEARETKTKLEGGKRPIRKVPEWREQSLRLSPTEPWLHLLFTTYLDYQPQTPDLASLTREDWEAARRYYAGLELEAVASDEAEARRRLEEEGEREDERRKKKGRRGRSAGFEGWEESEVRDEEEWGGS